MLTVTSNIGIGVLRSALRLVENYTDIEEVEVIDTFASGCEFCEYKCGSDACSNCKRKIFKTELKKVYVNEKNQYGVRKVLKKNALLLFFYLHFLEIDDMGYSRVNIDEAAEFIKCDVKTVRNNLKLLEKNEYILLRKAETPGFYQYFIKNYKDYFKKSFEGGRGYVTISKEFFIKLTESENIDSIRLLLRSFLHSVDITTKTYTRKERTYKEIKRELPKHCTKKTISNIMSGESFTSIFDVVKKKHSVAFKVKSEFNPKHVVAKFKDECREGVMSFIHNKNNKRESGQPILKIDYKDLLDIQNISLRYSLDLILESLETFYQDYFLAGLEFNSVGALIRTIASSNTEFEARI